MRAGQGGGRIRGEEQPNPPSRITVPAPMSRADLPPGRCWCTSCDGACHSRNPTEPLELSAGVTGVTGVTSLEVTFHLGGFDFRVNLVPLKPSGPAMCAGALIDLLLTYLKRLRACVSRPPLPASEEPITLKVPHALSKPHLYDRSLHAFPRSVPHPPHGARHPVPGRYPPLPRLAKISALQPRSPLGQP